MNLREIWTEVEAVRLTASMHDVLDWFRHHREWAFMPVVDEENRVLGVIREFDLKNHAYAQFGRDLIKRQPLNDFVRPSLALSVDVTEKELLDSSAQNPNPDGIVLTERGKYRAVLQMRAVLRLFEQRHLESEIRLVQVQKMEAIGTLAGGIAHDLNNILTPILGYSELMSLLLRQGEPIEQDDVDQIIVSAKRARDLVRQILAFSRHQKSERCCVRLSRVIKEALPLVRASLPATIDIEMRLDAEEDEVMVNPDEMHRVLLNLCTNAFHAMRERGGHLLITLGHHQGPVLGWSMHDELLLGDYVRLSVTDTGVGIKSDLLPRIFEPFFTTERQGEGTGLGLPIVHGIVSRSKGVISVESVIGQGSSFHIYLPRLARTEQGDAGLATKLANEQFSITRSDGMPLTILFVDDEFAVTRLAGQILPNYGINVVTQNDSCKALAMFSERAADFDLLVTDQIMPGLSGVMLTREVLKIKPELPVILCTGYSEEASPEQAKEMGVAEYVLKPPDFQMMAGMIRRLVTAAKSRRGDESVLEIVGQ